MSTHPNPSDFTQMPDWVFELERARPVSIPAKTSAQLRAHERMLNARFARSHARDLPDVDLLELTLARSLPRADVQQIAQDLLDQFGDYNRVISAPSARLMEVAEIDEMAARDLKLIEACAHRLARSRILSRPVLSGWQAVLDYCQTSLAHLPTEEFHALFLDSRNTMIADETIARGTVNHVSVYPREVVKRALELDASAMILLHNHPSGDPTPSPEDIAMTAEIMSAAGALDITLHDHIIVGKSNEVSFRSLGYI